MPQPLPRPPDRPADARRRDLPSAIIVVGVGVGLGLVGLALPGTATSVFGLIVGGMFVAAGVVWVVDTVTAARRMDRLPKQSVDRIVRDTRRDADPDPYG